MGMSRYLRRSLARWALRNTPMPSPPPTIYIGLHTADPGDQGAHEVSIDGTSYARSAVTTGQAGTGIGSGFTDPTNASTVVSENVSAIPFPSPTANWGTVGYWSIWDAASGGNFLGGVALASPRAINNGDGAPRFDPETLTLETQ